MKTEWPEQAGSEAVRECLRFAMERSRGAALSSFLASAFGAALATIIEQDAEISRLRRALQEARNGE